MNDGEMSDTTRGGCCAERRKPCPYHEGWADGIDYLAEVAAEWLRAAGYPFDVSFDQPPPVLLRPFIETAWPDRDGVVDPTERLSYRQAVAEEGGWRDATGHEPQS